MSKLLDNLQITIDKFTENTGTPPYALVCNKKTYDAIAQELYATLRWEKTRYFKDPPSFKVSTKSARQEIIFRDIPIIQNNNAPDNKIYAVDECTCEKTIKEEQ